MDKKGMDNLNIDKDSKDSSNKLEHWQVISVLLVLYDIVAIHVAYFFALWSRFDFRYSQIPANYLSYYMRFITIYSIVSAAFFWFFNLYRSMWRFASYTELIRSLEASFLTSFLHAILIKEK